MHCQWKAEVLPSLWKGPSTFIKAGTHFPSSRNMPPNTPCHREAHVPVGTHTQATPCRTALSQKGPLRGHRVVTEQ